MIKIAKALLVTLAIVAPLSVGALDAQAKTAPHANTMKIAAVPTNGAKVAKVHHKKHKAKHTAKHNLSAHRHTTGKKLARK